MITREHIIEHYKLLFAGRHGYPSCGDGWMLLIDNFLSLVAHDMAWNSMPPVKVQQIKEKFGALEIYFEGGNEKTLAYALFARSMSVRVCEVCGTTKNIGKTSGWIKTICKDCHETWSNSPAAEIRGKREWLPEGSDANKMIIKQLYKIKEE